MGCAKAAAMKPRIALLHYTAPPVVGGVEAIVGVHARLLAGAGYRTAIVVGRGRGGPGVRAVVRPLLDSRHPEIRAASRDLDRGETTPAYHRLVDRLTGLLASAVRTADLVLAHNVLTLHKNLPLTAALWRVASVRGPRVVAWTHDLAFANPQDAPVLHPGEPWDLLRTRHPAVTYVAVSPSVATHLREVVGITDARVIPNGVDEASLAHRAPAIEQLVRAHRLLEREIVLLAPVRITRRKNLELALRVLAALVESGSDALLVVAGPIGPHNPQNRAYLNELLALRRSLRVEDRALFLSADPSRTSGLRTAEVGDLYQMCDAVLLTSTLEGFGLPPLEAGLYRLPVFASNLEVFRQVAGDLFHPFDLDAPPREIAQQIRDALAADRAYRLRLLARRTYRWPAIFAEHIEPLIHRLL